MKLEEFDVRLRSNKTNSKLGLVVTATIAPTVVFALSPVGNAEQRPPFAAGRAAFSVGFRGGVVPYTVMAAFAVPNESMSFSAAPAGAKGRYRVALPSAGEIATSGSWRWTAPAASGVYPMRIRDTVSDSTITLNVFVTVPYSKLEGESLSGYRIGKYPLVAYKGLDIYRPPRGFVEVTADNRNTPVSPHFTLEQFLCKQGGEWPKYLVLRERLLLKLELLLEHVNAAGHRCDSFAVMSGYRTPYYNHLIGNVKYSRHQWGGAADIFIDEDPADGVMDDLNRDGRLDVRDAHVLYEIVDRMYGKPWYEPFVGGLGAYRRTSKHGPFVHVDARGFRARWGD